MQCLILNIVFIIPIHILPAFFQTEIMSEGKFPLFLFHNVVSDTEIDYMVKTASKQVLENKFYLIFHYPEINWQPNLDNLAT